MAIYFAPLEGITTYIYRNAFHHVYGGADKYFTPFITSATMSHREQMDTLPEHNSEITVVPQILTNRVDEFLDIAKRLHDLGYETVNLNLGCPSGTVVSKKRGSGFLSVPDDLHRFLDEIFDGCECNISIKTRIGLSSLDEWEAILKVYQQIPMEELIIHPRLQKEFYKGTPHLEAFTLAKEMLPKTKLCYNGDIHNIASYENVMEQVAPTDIMLGRGLIAKPELLGVIAGESAEDATLDVARFTKFHNEIYTAYCDEMSGPSPTLFKMKELWTYWIHNFPGEEKTLKRLLKTKKLAEYEGIVGELLHSLDD